MMNRREWLATSAAVAVTPQFSFSESQSENQPITNLLKDGEKSTDYRLGKLKTLDDYFPFAVPSTLEEWKARAAALRTQLKVAVGIYPEPEKSPLNAVIHGKIDRGDYTIEKVFFQSMPGHTVCGNLYRPKKSSGKTAGVLFAHGHWENGRFHDTGEATAKKMVERGEEPDLERARLFMQALPTTLAKLGFVCFQFDMVGYADSTTVKHIARSGVPHSEGFADAQSEMWLQSLMGLQTWNCIRSIDFLSSLPDVDANRIGMTGASGGGTQTFITAALDERIAAAFPAVMVSTAMQGGCVCENCSLLRVNTGNVEISGLIAPRPLAMSGANDWSKEIETKGLPELKKLYSLYGKEELVSAKCWPQFPHNYGQPSREMMYGFFLKHLLGKTETVKEPLFEPLPVKSLTVFDADHPRPKDELPSGKLREALTELAKKSLAEKASKPEPFRDWVSTALKAMMVTDYPKSIEVRKGPIESKPDGVTMHLAMFGRKGEKIAVPSAGVFGPKFTGGKAVIWVDPKGKSSIFENGKVIPAARSLIDAGYAVIAMDSFGSGEAKPTVKQEVNKTYSAFTYGYNRTPLANRVHDILTITCFARTMLNAKTVHLVGWGETGPAAILAKAVAGEAFDRCAVDLNQFKFDSIKDPADPMLLPGALKYGGMPAFLAACAPGAVLAHNHRGTETGRLPKAIYDGFKAGDKLKREPNLLEPAKVVEWLIG